MEKSILALIMAALLLSLGNLSYAGTRNVPLKEDIQEENNKEIPETTFPELPAVSPQEPKTAPEATASAVE